MNYKKTAWSLARSFLADTVSEVYRCVSMIRISDFQLKWLLVLGILVLSGCGASKASVSIEEDELTAYLDAHPELKEIEGIPETEGIP